MGRSKDMHMEWRMKLEASEKTYMKIPFYLREEIEIKRRFLTGIKREEDPKWLELRKESAKAYKALKDYEYEQDQKQINKA